MTVRAAERAGRAGARSEPPSAGRGPRAGLRLGVDVAASTRADAGIGRYAEELPRHLLGQARTEAGALEALVLFTHGGPPPWLPWGAQDPDGGAVPAVRVERYGRWGHAALRANVFLGPAIARSGVQVFHSLDTLGVPLTIGRGVALVATVHDLIPWKFPREMTTPHRLARRATLPLVVRRADRLIAVSQATAQDLLDVFPQARDRVRVVHQGVSDRFAPASREEVTALRSRLGLPRDYLIYVGALSPRKNLGRVFEAYDLLRRQGADIPPLVVAGRRGWLWEPIVRTISDLRLHTMVRVCDFVPDSDLPALITGARALLHPSLYEGFGLPPLEAMACGTPALTSNRSSLPEIAGDAALLVDPDSPEAIADGIRRLLDDTAYREDLIARGFRRVAEFSAPANARRTLAVYREALDER